MRLYLAVFAAALLASCGKDAAKDDPAETPDGGTTPLGPAGPPKWLGVAGERLGPLPPQVPSTSSTFTTHDACAQCHSVGVDRLRDAKGRDVSPVGTWRATPMALSARDPYWLTAFADELAARPASKATIEETCTRCHAPEGHLELSVTQKTLSFDAVTKEASSTNDLAREGVACTLCHQIQPTSLGDVTSFGGNFLVGQERQMFGPYQNPVTGPMQTVVNFTPTFGQHVMKSALCASCHTVILKSRDSGGVLREIAEQAPYLEWLASDFVFEGRPGPKAADCHDCHMPSNDDDGAPLNLAIAKNPTDLNPRRPFRRHLFAGGNPLLSRFAASDPTWIGASVPKEDHEKQAALAEASVKRAAKVELLAPTRDGAIAVVPVVVTNEAGHKFPTGYPSRRAFLHVVAKAPGGEVIFESGHTDEHGRLVTRDGRLVDDGSVLPHRDVIGSETEVQVYESVLADAAGRPVHRAFDAAKYAKDNRLVPSGFQRKSSYAKFVDPVGVDADPNWGSADTVTYRIDKAPPGTTITVRLLFQTVRPTDIEAYAEKPTPVARKLFDFVSTVGLAPVVIAEATGVVP